MKNKIFVIVLVVLAVGGFVVLKATQKPAPPAPVAQTVAPDALAETFVRPHSPVFGNTMGRATVVEWFDPECEACRAVHPIVKDMIGKYKDRVRFVLRYMPYHTNSMFAATALEEAREHGKFEKAMDILFERQPEWGNHHDPKPELIVEYLAKLGIPRDKLDRDYLLKKHGEKIRIDEADGKAVGIRGTPTFFVNGEMVQQLGEAPLREAIESALQ